MFFKKNYINRVNGLYEEKGCRSKKLKPGENCNTYKCIDGKEKHFIMKFIFVLSIVLDNNGVNSYSYCKFHDVNMGCSQTNISVTINIYSTIYLNKKKSDNVFHIYLAMSCQF